MSFKPVRKMMHSNNQTVSDIGHYLARLIKYMPMLSGMVKKDFNSRFRSSFLGYCWHVIIPLVSIVVNLIVFSYIFGRDIPNYWAYLSAGMFPFAFFTSSLIGCSTAITGNSGMVTKMAFPYEILVFSKATSSLITFIISYSVLTILIIAFGVNHTIWVCIVPLIMILEYAFVLGLGLLVSAITVYIRDMAQVVSVLTSCMMFATPLFYMRRQMGSGIIETLWAINPMVYYVECFHDALYSGVCPNMKFLLVCIILSTISFLIGFIVFVKLKKGFGEML